MGYRSEVGLCLNKMGKAALDKALQEAEQENHPELEEFKKMFTTRADEKREDASGAVAYLWKNTKWYNDSDGYPDVAFVEDFMNRLDSADDDNIEYLFLRVGESYDDIEERGRFWDNPLGMGIVRDVAFNA
jgi:hypothetical protein